MRKNIFMTGFFAFIALFFITNEVSAKGNNHYKHQQKEYHKSNKSYNKGYKKGYKHGKYDHHYNYDHPKHYKKTKGKYVYYQPAPPLPPRTVYYPAPRPGVNIQINVPPIIIR